MFKKLIFVIIFTIFPFQAAFGQDVAKSLTTEKIIYHGLREKPQVALTFDADMTPYMAKKLRNGKIKSWYNQKITEILINENIPATFFLSGMWIEIYPEETKNLAENSLFELGNHSYSHPSFGGKCYRLKPIPDNKDQEEIDKTQKLLKEITGVENRLFRFPGGCFEKKDLKIVNQNNLTAVFWDVISGDSFNNNKKEIISNVLKNTRNGSIILMHLNGGPNAPATAEALPIIINKLREKGFEFVKVSQLL